MVEILIITVLVLWSCIIVFKKLMPKTAQLCFEYLAKRCQAKGWTGVAKWLKPKQASGCGGNCGCGSEDQANNEQEIKTVKWK